MDRHALYLDVGHGASCADEHRRVTTQRLIDHALQRGQSLAVDVLGSRELTVQDVLLLLV